MLQWLTLNNRQNEETQPQGQPPEPAQPVTTQPTNQTSTGQFSVMLPPH